MNVYEKIDAIFQEEQISQRPPWVDEILDELRQIRKLASATNQTAKKIDRNYYSFVNEFRQKMKANTHKGIYPEVEYDGRKLGVNFKGYLYDKETSKSLSTKEAFSVYRYLYESNYSMV